jgi:hypothetical protein
MAQPPASHPPANPPRKQPLLLAASLALWLVWLGFLIWLAWYVN